METKTVVIRARVTEEHKRRLDQLCGALRYDSYSALMRALIENAVPVYRPAVEVALPYASNDDGIEDEEVV